MMKILVLNLILFHLAVIKCQHEEYFSSLVQLEKLAVIESKFIIKLRAILDKVDDDYYVKKKLDYWIDEHSILEQDVSKYIANPLNAFGMIKRATADISLVMKRIPLNLANELARYRIKDLSLTDAVRNLLLVQRIYKLSTADIARGYIKNIRIGDRMTPHDLYTVGKTAANITNEEFFAKKYLELAHQKFVDGYDEYDEIDEYELLMKIINLCERIKDYKCSAYYLKQLLTAHPDDTVAGEYAIKIVKLFKEYGTTMLSFDDPYDAKIEKNGKYSRRKEFELISDVCRGKVSKNVMEMSKLHCRYVSSTPFTLLAPFKVEEVNLDPYIAIYLNVLSNNEIQSLRNATMRETHRNSKKDADEKSIFDVIRMASLYDNNNELTARISRRIEDMTGLSVDAMEPLNVENFGVGGPVWKQEIQQKGHKMAMILFYMNDDHMGGYTAFPYLKVRIVPREGSALFWFTLKNSGQHEYGTRYTQCPVWYKSKWIAYKYLYEHGQEFKRPCLANEKFVQTSVDDYDREFF